MCPVVLRGFQGYFKEVSKVCKESFKKVFKEVSSKSQVCFKKILRVFQECFMGV